MQHRRSRNPYEFSVLPGLHHADAGQLKMLFRMDAAKVVWDSADLAVLWRQQLCRRIVDDLAPADGGARASIDAMGMAQSPPIISFGQLLWHSAAPTQLFDMVRQFAKARITSPEYLELRPISKALYYATIAAAICNRHPNPTGLAAPELQAALTWLCSRPWLDGQTRARCHSAISLKAVAAPAHHP